MPTITEKVVRRARRRYGVKVLWHKQWGSRRRELYSYRRKHRPVSRIKTDTLWQHISVTRPSGDFKADVRAVERIGYERFGTGTSYNFVVDMETGQVAVGQPLDAKGAHTINNKGVDGFSYNQNLVARAIAVLGMPDTPLSRKAERAIAGLIAAMIDVGAATADPDYEPHSLVAWKDCPCDPTRNRMKMIYLTAKALKPKRRRRRPERREDVSLRKVRRAARRPRWARRFPATRQDVGIVLGALDDEGVHTYRGWQIRHGIDKKDATGVPDRASLVELGKRNGFRVVN